MGLGRGEGRGNWFQNGVLVLVCFWGLGLRV